ncbi:MAG: hypothetical protein QGH26_03805 [Candidatus Pacebacteria bacterium]|jgi:hypothetical protein|nr:hypothetical protein [Candidatus Paceibacterota bacterium]|tara:strand:- start:133 stop:483 length:351 start_codon:yes stop_codon:yes gene_type:complete
MSNNMTPRTKQEMELVHEKKERLEKENKNLKYLLGEAYEISALDDMINDGCRDRDNDEFLMCNLSLKSQILEALDEGKEKRGLSKDLKSLVTDKTISHQDVSGQYYEKKNGEKNND